MRRRRSRPEGDYPGVERVGMTPEELATICTTVERGMREYSLLGCPEKEPLPPPIDRAAEAEVSSAIVGGSITLEDLPGLHAKHFSHPLHRVVIEVAPKAPVDTDGCLSLAFVEYQLREAGHRGDLEAWLIMLRDAIPFRGRESSLIAATRVRELWRRRRLIERLRHIVVALKTDTLTTDGAIAKLREMISSGPARKKAA
jgi:hypothetical protein